MCQNTVTGHTEIVNSDRHRQQLSNKQTHLCTYGDAHLHAHTHRNMCTHPGMHAHTHACTNASVRLSLEGFALTAIHFPLFHTAKQTLTLMRHQAFGSYFYLYQSPSTLKVIDKVARRGAERLKCLHTFLPPSTAQSPKFNSFLSDDLKKKVKGQKSLFSALFVSKKNNHAFYLSLEYVTQYVNYFLKTMQNQLFS